MIVIKIGGNVVSQLTPAFFQCLTDLRNQGEQVLIVHGGGNLISECGNFVGETSHKINGIRVTTPAMMHITKTVLTDVVQPALKQKLSQHGIASTMLNAADYPFLFGDYLDQAQYGEVGVVKQVAYNYLDIMTEKAVGLCAPLVFAPNHRQLNVNADLAAASIATLTHADKLVLITDVPGVMENGHIVKQLSQHQAHQMMASGALHDGMLPKIDAAFQTLQSGVASVAITNHLTNPGTLIVQ